MAADYDTLVYTEVGGSKMVVADGGEIEVQSGGTLDIQDGATFNVDVLTVTDVVTVGEFDSVTAGSGIPLSSDATAAFRVYADDGGVAITSTNEKAILSRFLITVSPGDCTLEGILGQIKYASGVHCSADYQSGIRGYLELVGGNTVNTGGANANIGAGASAVRALVDVDANTTIATNHYLCGYQAQLRVKPAFSVTQNGKLVAYGVFADDQAGGATPTDKWGYAFWAPGNVSDRGIFIGTDQDTAGGAIPLSTGGITTANAFYADDGAAALAGGYYECLTARQLYATAITSGDGVSSAAMHGDVYLAVSVFTGGGMSGIWGGAGIKTLMTIDTSNGYGELSGGHFSVDVPSGAIIATGSWVAGASVGGNLGGTHTGKAAGFRVRTPSAGVWDYGLYIMSDAVTTGIDVGTCTTAINLDGTYTYAMDITDGVIRDTQTISAAAIDLNMDIDMATAGAAHVPALYIDANQSTAYSGGALSCFKGKVYTTEHITNVYGVQLWAYSSGTHTMNDMVAVEGIVITGGTISADTPTSSSCCALRGYISNYSTGSWDGRVACLFLNYGSNVNYGDETAYIYMMSHSDTKLDYGIHFTCLSAQQAVTAGILIEPLSGATVTTGIDIDGAGTITTGIDVGACTTGITFTGAQTTSVDISATSLTDGILIDGATTEDGIHISSNCTGASLNITGTTSARAIMVGAMGTELVLTQSHNYPVGIFSKIGGTIDPQLDVRGLRVRTRIDDDCVHGSAGTDKWGYGIWGIEGQIVAYGGTTNLAGWMNAGVWGMFETDGTASVTVNEAGATIAAIHAHMDLALNTVIDTDAYAVGVSILSNSASTDLGNNYYGARIYTESGKVNWATGLQIDTGFTVAGINIDGGTGAGNAISIGASTAVQVDGTPDYAVEIFVAPPGASAAYTNMGALNATNTCPSGYINTGASFTTAVYGRLEFTGGGSSSLGSGWHVANLGYFKTVGTVTAVSPQCAAVAGIVNVAANFTIGIGGWLCGFLAGSYGGLTAHGYYIGYAINDLGGTDFDYGMYIGGGTSTTGIYIDAETTGMEIAACTDGIVISGACTDNGIEITGNCTGAVIQNTGTCGKFLECGLFGAPIVYDGSDDFCEIHASIDHATNVKPAFRIRNSPQQAMSASGTIVGLEASANSNASDDAVYNVWGANLAAQMKSACHVLAGGFFVGAKIHTTDLASIGATIDSGAIAAGCWISTGWGQPVSGLHGALILSSQGALPMNGIIIIPDDTMGCATGASGPGTGSPYHSFIYTMDDISDWGSDNRATFSSGTLTATGTLEDTNVKCDARMRIRLSNKDYWVALYDTAP